jgi:hypothetical protein
MIRSRVGEIERTAGQQVGLQWNPGLQVRAGLNDGIVSGRARDVETKGSIGEKWVTLSLS